MNRQTHKKRLRIALVTETCYPQINGVSRTLDRLMETLLAEGDEVQLYCPRYSKTREPRPGLSITDFRSIPLPFYPEIKQPMVLPSTLRKHFRHNRPDLVHIATEGILGRCAMKAARQLGLPVVTSYHTNFPQYLSSYGLGPLTPWLKRNLKDFHNQARLTFCPTPSIARALMGEGFDHVEVWSRGVDSTLFHPDKRNDATRERYGLGPDDRVLLYSGRLAAEKNLLMLIEAFGQLADPDLKLLLVGDGPLRAQLEKTQDPRIRFTGYLRGQALAETYACADLMTFPSLTETFGNVILEGMAAGLPTLAFHVPGPTDIIQRGLTGELVEPITARAFSDVLAAMLAEPALLRKRGLRARIHAELQNWDQINAVVRRGYIRALEQPTRQGVQDSVPRPPLREAMRTL